MTQKEQSYMNQADREQARAMMVLESIGLRSPLRRFSWNRVRYMLDHFDSLVESKTAFLHQDVVFMEMLYSNCLLMLSENRVAICKRDAYPPKPTHLALPPKDVQGKVKQILLRYGQTQAQKNETVH